MSHAQYLRDLLEPLGVYRWEGTFQWGELQSQGAALDEAARELAALQREMNLYTAQEKGLAGVLALLGREEMEGTVQERRETAAALLRIGGGSFTLAAINDTLRGCGIAAQAEETESPTRVKISFPGVVGVPDGFVQLKARIEAILPAQLQVEYQFASA